MEKGLGGHCPRMQVNGALLHFFLLRHEMVSDLLLVSCPWGSEGLLRCGKSCRLRWINYLRSDLKRGNITKEEEAVIIKLHATLGNR